VFIDKIDFTQIYDGFQKSGIDSPHKITPNSVIFGRKKICFKFLAWSV